MPCSTWRRICNTLGRSVSGKSLYLINKLSIVSRCLFLLSLLHSCLSDIALTILLRKNSDSGVETCSRNCELIIKRNYGSDRTWRYKQWIISNLNHLLKQVGLALSMNSLKSRHHEALPNTWEKMSLPIPPSITFSFHRLVTSLFTSLIRLPFQH